MWFCRSGFSLREWIVTCLGKWTRVRAQVRHLIKKVRKIKVRKNWNRISSDVLSFFASIVYLERQLTAISCGNKRFSYLRIIIKLSYVYQPCLNEALQAPIRHFHKNYRKYSSLICGMSIHINDAYMANMTALNANFKKTSKHLYHVLPIWRALRKFRIMKSRLGISKCTKMPHILASGSSFLVYFFFSSSSASFVHLVQSHKNPYLVCVNIRFVNK